MSQHDFITGLVDALARGGVREVVLSPGYRSAPLAFALAAHPGLRLHVVVDERAAAFFALGLARARGGPVALACTSGSAAANYLPAIVEAFHARIPLVVLTADRPIELQHAGAAQTITQPGLYRDFVVHQDELAEPPALDQDLPRAPWPARVARALLAATDPAGGPVHLNIPLRKPLLPPDPDAPASPLAPPSSSSPAPASPLADPRAPASPWPPPPRLLRGERRLSAADLAGLRDIFAGARRPLLLAGPMLRSLAAREGEAILGLAARSGWPLLADALSPARPRALQRADAIARADLPPADAILWFGQPPTSAALARWIQRAQGPVVHVVADGRWADPAFTADHLVWADPAALAESLDLASPADPTWLPWWREREAAAEAHLAAHLHDPAAPWEGALLARVLRAWPGGHVHVASSLAVRDLDAVGHLRPGQRALSSRGVNGIDGTLATAAGEALGVDAPLLAIVGDLALAHDLGALVHAPATATDRLVVVVIDNRGGQIFRQLPLQGRADFERLFVTPTPVDLAHLAAAAGWHHRRPEGDDALRRDLAGAHARGRTLIELTIDPVAAAAARRAFWQRWR